MNKREEMDYMAAFVAEAFFDSEIECDQLRALWTAYCLHYNLDVDTLEYDRDLEQVWKEVASTENDTAYWSDFGSFGDFMGEYLV